VSKEPQGQNRLKSLRSTLSQEMMSENHIGTIMAENFDIIKMIFDDFSAGSTAERRQEIRTEMTTRFTQQDRPAQDVAIFETFLRFNECVLKHNFFRVNKAALAFRLDPTKFINFLDFPRMPHGIFMFVSGNWRGFHVRFTDIARGGVRMIISKTNKYKVNKRMVFQENYNLAHTQLLKNKDIPEGGSKGTILVSPRYTTAFKENKCRLLFLQYVDALLDVIIPGTSGVVDNYKKEEIIFLGPDENTAGTFPRDGALYSKERGYSAWKSFTTGKDPFLGGIPHDTYGMTTRSVRQCVEGIYEKLNMVEESLTKFQTGGPDGDLGSNEILRSKEKYMGLVDISGVVYDPAGVNKAELVRLAKARDTIDKFDTSKLSSRGFLVKSSDTNVKLPDGTVVDGASFRDNFHFSPLINTDVFVPCGGRPASVTLQNVHRFINLPDIKGEKMLAGEVDVPKGALKFKVIVEGANLFITQDARLALEKCGVVVIKDATANKGGVTSSSLEVFTGLALNDEEHKQLMSAKNEKDAPQFYKDLVEEICSRVEHNARREFDAIWREYEANPLRPKTLICDDLSRKIVEIRQHILNSDIFDDKKFMFYVINQYAPNTLKYTVPVGTIVQRVPEKYLRAIGAIYLASDYVYTKGSSGNEFDFFQSMRKHFEASRAK
jgi:glutamate dehydrogenase